MSDADREMTDGETETGTNVDVDTQGGDAVIETGGDSGGESDSGGSEGSSGE